MSDSARWTSGDSARLYRFAEWGQGYFGVSPGGNVTVHADPGEPAGIDLHEVIEALRSRELHTPLLLRFAGVLEHRLRSFQSTFEAVIDEAEYQGRYSLCYPIKVNQQRHVCEEIRDVSRELGFGFEVGSKPELIAALGLTAADPQMPILCNGFKDLKYLEVVLLASKLGRNIVPIVERVEELEAIIDLSKRHEHWPAIGVRTRLAASGAGRWLDSSGSRGKFGLSARDLLHVVSRLEDEGHLDSLQLLHCHIGSQIEDIAAVKRAVTEVAHMYVELRKRGAPLRALDLGGGLGVDYDGSQSSQNGSVNYGLTEYVSDVVWRVKQVCDSADVPHPDLITESGRAAVAYSSVLVVDVLGTRILGNTPSLDLSNGGSLARDNLVAAVDRIRRGEDPAAAYHDAEHARTAAEELFALGHLSLEERASCEDLFWEAARGVLEGGIDFAERDELEERMADQYYCNFSLFQSLPDTWAIDQLFPIAPIHRLNEEPTRAAILGDITCDSDGRITQFLVGPATSPTLPLHPRPEGPGSADPYYLGIFLVGAYQETLGDLHNLFGDTHAIHIVTNTTGDWEIGEVVEADTTREVLGYVQYEPEALKRSLGREIEAGIRSGHFTVAEANGFRRVLELSIAGYTYLTDDGLTEF